MLSDFPRLQNIPDLPLVFRVPGVQAEIVPFLPGNVNENLVVNLPGRSGQQIDPVGQLKGLVRIMGDQDRGKGDFLHHPQFLLEELSSRMYFGHVHQDYL